MPNKALRSESLWPVRCIEPKNAPAASSATGATDVMMILRIKSPPHGRLDLIARAGRPATRCDELKSNTIRLPPPRPDGIAANVVLRSEPTFGHTAPRPSMRRRPGLGPIERGPDAAPAGGCGL